VSDGTQSFAHHARWVPPFHFVVLPILLVNLIWSIWQAFKAFSWPTVLAALVAFALLGMAIYARNFTLTVQDRVIRLEMRLRMRELLPADLQARIGEVTREQCVGLRFASDPELPALVRRVLSGELKTTREIKQQVAQWQGDYLRA
jgi:hypothetical protein